MIEAKKRTVDNYCFQVYVYNTRQDLETNGEPIFTSYECVLSSSEKNAYDTLRNKFQEADLDTVVINFQEINNSLIEEVELTFKDFKEIIEFLFDQGNPDLPNPYILLGVANIKQSQ